MTINLTDLSGVSAIQTASGWVELEPLQWRIDAVRIYGGRQLMAIIADVVHDLDSGEIAEQVIIPIECVLGWRGQFTNYRSPAAGLDIGAPAGIPASNPDGVRGQRASVPSYPVRA